MNTIVNGVHVKLCMKRWDYNRNLLRQTATTFEFREALIDRRDGRLLGSSSAIMLVRSTILKSDGSRSQSVLGSTTRTNETSCLSGNCAVFLVIHSSSSKSDSSSSSS
jgi:hypothetical protein